MSGSGLSRFVLQVHSGTRTSYRASQRLGPASDGSLGVKRRSLRGQGDEGKTRKEWTADSLHDVDEQKTQPSERRKQTKTKSWAIHDLVTVLSPVRPVAILDVP